MTYVTDQTPKQLRAHMKRLQAMSGWHNPLDDRLYAEIVTMDAELDRLRTQNQALLEALQEARNGLAWYQSMYPGATDGSDDEAMERIDAALAQAEGGV